MSETLNLFNTIVSDGSNSEKEMRLRAENFFNSLTMKARAGWKYAYELRIREEEDKTDKKPKMPWTLPNLKGGLEILLSVMKLKKEI